MFSLIVKSTVAIILGLGGVAYIMLMPNPDYLMVVVPYLIAVVLAGWAVSDVIQFKK